MISNVFNLFAAIVPSLSEVCPELNDPFVLAAKATSILQRKVKKIIEDRNAADGTETTVTSPLSKALPSCKPCVVPKSSKQKFKMGRTNLYKLLRSLGRRVVHDRNFLYEKPSLVKPRHRYLKRIKDLRAGNSFIVYMNDTWIFEGMRSVRDWLDTTAIENPKKFIDRGLKIGHDPSTSRGKRRIVVGCIAETGLMLIPLRFGPTVEERQIKTTTRRWTATYSISI